MRGLALIAASLAINFAIAFVSHELGRRTCPAPNFEAIGEITQVARRAPPTLPNKGPIA